MDGTKLYLCWQTTAGDSVSLSAVPDNTESPHLPPVSLGRLERALKLPAAWEGAAGWIKL